MTSRPIVEHFHAIDIRELQRERRLEPGAFVLLSWRRGDVTTGTAAVQVGEAAVDVHYRPGPDEFTAWTPRSERISLCRTVQRIGSRGWFVCPRCQRRCAVLLFAPWARCRICLGAHYTSEYEGATDRARRRAEKLRARLCGELNVMARVPPRPKWMQHRTYGNLVTRIRHWERRYLAGVAAELRRRRAS